MAWEIDLWGRIRAQRAAAEANAEAVALDYAYARQSLAATTAKLWYLGVETRQLLALSERAVSIYSELLDLVQIRRSAGKDSDLDVVDVRAKLETAQSDVERARESYGEVRRALEVVLGPLSRGRDRSRGGLSSAASARRNRRAVDAARTPARSDRGRARGARGVPPAGSRAACAAA